MGAPYFLLFSFFIVICKSGSLFRNKIYACKLSFHVGVILLFVNEVKRIYDMMIIIMMFSIRTYILEFGDTLRDILNFWLCTRIIQ